MNWGCFFSLESSPILIKPVKHEHFLYNLIMPLVHFSVFLLDGEWWNHPLGSSLSCSDCAHKASRKLGEVNRGQAVLQAVKQLCVWLKTILSWNINIPAGSHHALSPYCFSGRLHDGPGGASSWVKMEEEGIVLWLGRNIGNGTCMGLPKGDTVEVHWQEDFLVNINVWPHR